jgi:glyoxylase-like metal-dependent hydrolase (beta-lactamase superfamily II)
MWRRPAHRLRQPKRLVRLRSLPLLTALFLLSAVMAAEAYRTDHGFLPPGTSTCDVHVPVTLSVPPNAAPIPDPFQGQYSGGFYHVEEINHGLFYMTDGVYQAMFLVSDGGIILVDAPPSIGVNQQDPQRSVSLLDIIYSIPETRRRDIKKLIYSHSHLDHIGAASVIKDAFPNVEIIAHEETKELITRGTGTVEPFLAGAGSIPPPLPETIFRDQATVMLGSQGLELSYQGAIHQPGNIFIYAPKQRVLMLVDVIFPGWSPFSDLAVATDVPLFVAAHDKALAFEFDAFIGGHLNHLGTRADVEESRRYIQDIKANAITALFDPSLFAIFSIVPANSLGAFAIYLDQVACECANLTLNAATTPSGTDWRGRFGAADINTVGHCWRMAEALRIDPAF